jgi:hypothetical protein
MNKRLDLKVGYSCNGKDNITNKMWLIERKT